MASASGALSRTLLLLLLLLLLLVASTSPRESLSHAASQPMVAMKPVSALKSVVLNETLLLLRRRRRLNSFRICALCTCCGGPKGLCLPSPCCYAINCNIPNRPFGFCSFTPKTCNCFGCHL